MKKSTWFILGAFIVLLVSLISIQNSKDQPEAPTEITPMPALRNFNSSELVSITYQFGANDTIKFDNIDPLTWEVSSHPKGYVTAGNIESLTSILSNIPIISVLSSPPSLNQIGLSPPEKSIRFIFEDTTTYLLEIGNRTPLNNGYYAQIDRDAIVVLPLNSIDQITSIIENTIIFPTLPQDSEDG